MHELVRSCDFASSGSVSAQAAVIKHRRRGAFSDRPVFLSVLEAGGCGGGSWFAGGPHLPGCSLGRERERHPQNSKYLGTVGAWHIVDVQ